MKLDADLESMQQVRVLLEKAKQAQAIMEEMSQEQVDRIVHEMAQSSEKNAGKLAQEAVDETGYGKVEDKLTKNLFSARDIYESLKGKTTVGIVNRDDNKKVWEIAEPVGIVAAIIPSTNPTSTAIFKALIAVKARNAIVMSPHPAAAECTKEAVNILAEAAVKAGAPEGLISCIATPTVAGATALIQHKDTNVILATGGSAMVKAAYSSGKPAYGVGPGNVPVYVHESANVDKAAQQIIASKSFDWGTICASEQSLIVDTAIKHTLKKALENHGAYFVDDYEKQRLEGLIVNNGRLNPAIVGQSPQNLAKLAGILVPDNCKVLIAKEDNVGSAYPISMEKLSPILGFYTVDNEEAGNKQCKALLDFGGRGHTAGIYAENDAVVERFSLKQKAYRIIVNAGTTFGAIGATTNIQPSMTLGCGAPGNNITSDNIAVEHLYNIKRVAFAAKEMKQATPQHTNAVNQAIIHNYGENAISKNEIADIVKKVLQELNV